MTINDPTIQKKGLYSLIPIAKKIPMRKAITNPFASPNPTLFSTP